MEITKHVCENCLDSFNADKLLVVLKKSVFGEVMNHNILMCEDCAKKTKSEIIGYYIKRKVEFDTTGWIQKGETTSGTPMFVFIDDNGKKVAMTAASGMKKKFKPSK